ncbi:hypothetical protein DEO72_LG6g1240 [Vigna unguiculata]|uniref:Uncharacterized protein n=1 Tax=Vigna unguiculata TaxID=3917 RepID=A0A4D6M5P6_VIGUN|nr:hypothetical protein DEO72_LG6g1240 [Vigna unguiculata]
MSYKCCDRSIFPHDKDGITPQAVHKYQPRKTTVRPIVGLAQARDPRSGEGSALA